MENSYLVQRLKAPFPKDKPMAKCAGAFTFGGGLVNGGMSKQAMELISTIFRFDYMGSAEFEWGAVPEVLTIIFKNAKQYKTFEIETKHGNVYLFCREEWKDEVEKRIKAWAINSRNNEFYTKESVMLKDGLIKKYSWDDSDIPEHSLIKGWLELNNGYFFSVDKTMFDKFVSLFK